MSRKADPYETLGVAQSASPEQIAAAFRSLAKSHHPDRLPPGATPDDRARANAAMIRILKAHGILRDPSKRARYDQLRRAYPRSDDMAGVNGQAPRAPLEHVLRKVVAVSATRADRDYELPIWERLPSLREIGSATASLLIFLAMVSLVVLFLWLSAPDYDPAGPSRQVVRPNRWP